MAQAAVAPTAAPQASNVEDGLARGELLVALCIVGLSFALGFLLRWFVARRLKAWTARTAWKLDDALAASLDRPIVLWVVLAGLHLAVRIGGVPAHLLPVADRVLASALIVSVTFWAANLAVRLLDLAGGAGGESMLAATGVVKNVTRIVFFIVGAMVLLGNLGVSVTPVLTTLGIGGLAVALALQDTLSNIFAGMHITLAGNIRVGNFVKLESGEEGTIEDIGWRTTRVRVLPNNIVLIPNNRLAQSIVVNYDLPTQDLSVLVQVGVHYSSDLGQVERVTVEVGRQVLKATPGGVADFQPLVRYHTFADSSINFTVVLRAKTFADSYLLKHEFIKRLTKRYESEGIVIPFPIRTISLDPEQAAKFLESARRA